METVPEGLCRKAMELLQQEIAQSAHSYLPSMRKLSVKFGISAPIIAHAARLLKESGVIDFRKGRRIRIPALLPGSMPVPSTAVDRLAARIKESIEKGELRSGDPLPKFFVLTTELGLSLSTIARAFRRLKAENLAYRKGRQWIAGVEPVFRRDIVVRGTQPAIVIVLQDKDRRWEAIATAEGTARFCYEFSTEAERHGVALVSAVIGGPKASTSAHTLDYQSVKQLIARYDERFLGVLAINKLVENPHIVSWVRQLLPLGKPIVWFDRADERPHDFPVERRLTRCHFSERMVSACVVDFLAVQGHTVGVHPIYAPPGETRRFQEVRREWLSSRAAETGMMIHGVDLTVPHAQVQDVAPKGSQSLPVEGRRLLEYLRGHKGPLVLIASRDSHAYRYAKWLRTAGVNIPSHVSLISFDNRTYTQTLPLTTVDFGMDYLGYAAFHSILGVVRIRRERTGDITCKPRVIDRGSVIPVPQ